MTKTTEVTKEQFALWSFWRDRDVTRRWVSDANWEDLDQEERDLYLDEASYYLSLGVDNWPDDILERCEDTEGHNEYIRGDLSKEANVF